MKVYVKGQPEVSLSKSHFVAEGGEGKVFVLGDTGYKVYHDPKLAIPVGKIQDLSRIGDHRVIAPRDALYSGKKAQHVGHTFKFVADTWTLCQLFPRAFRDREGLDHKKALELVQQIQAGVHAVHRANVLVVDLNEMNFLVSKDFATPYFIDVDSYQTPRYPATAIMPSVRDPLVRGLDFTESSDWFSFAVVSFQLFVGIHPYKGKHPKVKGLEERMKAGISVFDRDVKMPKTAYGLDAIPSSYRDWYEVTFVHGRREAPPEGTHHVIVLRPTVRKITGTDNFEIVEVAEYDNIIRDLFVGAGHTVVWDGDQILIDRRHAGYWGSPLSVGFTPRHGHPIAALPVKHMSTHLMDLTSKGLLKEFTLPDGETVSANDTIYVRSRDKILEVVFAEAGNRIMASTRIAANVLEHACRLFPGVAIQSLLGDPHASIFPRQGACYQLALAELKGHKVVQAKHEGGVLMILAAEGGTYHRLVFRFDKDYSSYDLRKVEDVPATDLNFTVLDSGVCVCLNEDEELELFSARKGSQSVKTISDPILGGDMRLSKDGGTLIFHRGNKIYRMRMKGN